jgi:hypothetical protein
MDLNLLQGYDHEQVATEEIAPNETRPFNLI